jgi:hypothetical protein
MAIGTRLQTPLTPQQGPSAAPTAPLPARVRQCDSLVACTAAAPANSSAPAVGPAQPDRPAATARRARPAGAAQPDSSHLVAASDAVRQAHFFKELQRPLAAALLRGHCAPKDVEALRAQYLRLSESLIQPASLARRGGLC